MAVIMAVKFSDGGSGFKGRAPKATPQQMKARKQDEAAVKAAKARKAQTRQKIVIGGALWQLAHSEHDPEARLLLDRIIKSLTREVDRKLFQDR